MATQEGTAAMLAELLDHDGDRAMTTWEVGFIEDMAKRGSFTDNQKSKIEEIWQSIFA